MVSSNARILPDQKVIHFAWRESARKKVAVKSYFSEKNLDEIFGNEIPEELHEQFNELKKIREMVSL
jgi:hypothetical protein